MKKLITLATLLIMVLAFSITAQAADSPSGKPEETTTAPETTAPTPTTPVSPETGGVDSIFYIGVAAAAFATVALTASKKLEA